MAHKKIVSTEPPTKNLTVGQFIDMIFIFSEAEKKRLKLLDTNGDGASLELREEPYREPCLKPYEQFSKILCSDSLMESLRTLDPNTKLPDKYNSLLLFLEEMTKGAKQINLKYKPPHKKP
jgi:hypothetical protein